ncbi:hypothetical protein R4769_24730, partial [Azotobacter beijerinckii]|nr:hypothetical protein [Azotobacter beijerinckii]
FFACYQASPDKTPHTVFETVEKDHGRLEIRRCHAFDALQCLPRPEQWRDLKSFAVIESTRQVKGLQTTEYR